MKNIKYFLPVCIAFLICSACGDDFFETTLKVDPPPHEDQLVLHSFTKGSDSLILINVQQSFGILDFDNGEGGNVNDATIEIYENGVLRYEPQPTGDDLFNYALVLDGNFGGIGNTYEIKLKHSTLGEASATQVMPEAPVLISAIYDPKGGFTGDDGERADAIDLVIDDPAGVDNYYEVILTYIDEDPTNSYIYDRYSETLDANASPGMYDYHLLDGTRFDGEQYNFQLDLYEDYNENMHLAVRAISRDWYLYSKSMRAFQDSGDFELFAEPVTVHSNIDNGLGVFALATENIIKVTEQ